MSNQNEISEFCKELLRQIESGEIQMEEEDSGGRDDLMLYECSLNLTRRPKKLQDSSANE